MKRKIGSCLFFAVLYSFVSDFSASLCAVAEGVSDSKYNLKFNKTTFYTGEIVNFSLNFKSPEDNIIEVAVQDPEANGLKIVSISKPKVKDGSIIIDGALYAQSSGQFIIKPLELKYKVLKKENKQLSVLDLFLGSRYEIKTAYSNEVTLNALPLPKLEDNKKALAVGELKKLDANLSQKKISQSGAITFTLTLSGEGNFYEARAPELVLPEGLKYYVSSSKIEKDKKIFEYILQPIESGKFKIDSQEYLFFDPKLNKYKTLHSSGFELEVEKSIAQPIAISSKPQAIEPAVAQLESIKNFKEKISFESQGKPFIDLKIFIWLVLLPLIINFLIALIRFLLNFFDRALIFYRAKRKLRKALAENRPQDFYFILRAMVINYFDYKTIDADSWTDDTIKEKILTNCSKELALQWDELNSNLLQFSQYSQTKITADETRKLYSKILKFIKQFKSSRCKRISALFLLAFTFFVNGQINEIAALRRAQQLATSDNINRTEAQIKSVKQQNGIQYENIWQSKLAQVYLIINYLPFWFWQIIFIICWWILILFASLIGRRIKIIMVILLLVTSTISAINFYFKLKQRAIIKVEKPIVFLSPSANIEKHLNPDLYYGQDIEILNKIGKRFYAKSASGFFWINKENLEIV